MSSRSFVSILCAVLGTTASISLAELKVVTPKCEYASNPMGIDVSKPRLAWTLSSEDRGTIQTAYRVVAASSPQKASKGEGDVWDSGKVMSDQSFHVEYAGRALASRERVYWTIQAWDNYGNTSTSEVSVWEMGLLKPEDRTAKWIEFDDRPKSRDQSLANASWIWFPERAADKTQRHFVTRFEVPAGEVVKDALLTLSADDQFAVFINKANVGSSSGKTDAWRQAQTYEVKESIKNGWNSLAVRCSNEQGAAGLIALLTIEFESGKRQQIVTDNSWRTGADATPDWMNADKDPAGWVAARHMAAYGQGPWGELGGPVELGASPFVRTTMKVAKPVKSARLYASALGVYEFHINGERVGNDYFNPSWTDYNTRVQYHTYDVTSMLRNGDNAIGAIIGDGWYAGHVGLGGPQRYGKVARVWGQLEVEYADGTRQTIVTDGSWRGSRGPIIQSDMLMGEIYDARKELTGWSTPGYSDSTWGTAAVADVKPPMVAAVDAPIRQVIQLTTQAVTEPKPGVHVFDLGQNMVGWARLKVKGKAGDTVTLRFAEMLNPDGTIYTTNLRGAKCTDVYTLKGGEEELYEPKFTFHGFRYVELTGYPGKPDPSAVTGVVIQSDTPVSGFFECSDTRINQLQSNIVWGQRGNFIAVPTDCPQRDERLGWSGDAQVFVRTSTFNMDVARFFTKWAIDMEDAQRKDGAFTDVAPSVAVGAGTAAWGDAGVICPWTIYRVYGDTRILHERYASAQRWIEYLENHSKDLLRPAEGYGDWLSIAADTPKDVLATAFFAYSTDLTSRWAATIGKNEDAEKYRALFERIKAAFNKAYVTPDAKIKGDTQTCYVVALAFNLLPDELRAKAAEHLAADIKSKNNHLSTGFVGVGHLTPVLTKAGMTDIAYTLLTQDSFPGWLYSVKNGATTIWERWDGWTQEKGFQDPGMNSFNHYSLGSVGEWMYSTVLGIDLDAHKPAFKEMVIHPRPGGNITWARGHYDSMYGRIACAWKQEDGGMEVSVMVPANTTARVVLPKGEVTEGGKKIADVKGIRMGKAMPNEQEVVVGSGTYVFKVR
jgi:alpha-L-rhamnosidase